jgi:hypothetical protein
MNSPRYSPSECNAFFGADACGPTVVHWRPRRRNLDNESSTRHGPRMYPAPLCLPLLRMYFGTLAASEAPASQTGRRSWQISDYRKIQNRRVKQIRIKPTITGTPEVRAAHLDSSNKRYASDLADNPCRCSPKPFALTFDWRR